jgi:hypothetical protein
MPTYDINFTCPDCKGHVLEEKVEGVIMYYELHSFYQDEKDNYTVAEDYGDLDEFHEDAEVTGYLCQECGYRIGINAFDALAWLHEHEMAKEMKPNEPVDYKRPPASN